MATLTSKLSKDPVPGTATGVVTHAAATPGYRHPLDQLTPEEVRDPFLLTRASSLVMSLSLN